MSNRRTKWLAKLISDIFKKDKEEVYDYYYSEKHNQYLRSLAEFWVEDESYSYYEEGWIVASPKAPQKVFVNGIHYTEATKKGSTPFTNHFDDLKLVWSGKNGKITFEKYYNNHDNTTSRKSS